MSDAPPQHLAGRRCLITGGARGVGRALVHAFTQAGGQVAFTFHKSAADAAVTAKDTGALSFQGDVREAAHAAHVVKAVVEQWGTLDVLVCNAALMQVLPIGLLEERDWDDVMAVNVKGAYLFARAALKPMIRARRGHILFMGSFAQDRTAEAPAHYAASKLALVGLARSLAAEVGRYGIAVNVLSPGLLDTGMGARLPQHRVADYVAQCALGRPGQADEIARVATWLVSGEASLVTGACVVADGGL